VEAQEKTKKRFADQETQVGMAGPYTAENTDDITRQALGWNRQGKRSRWTPKNTWRKRVLEEAKGQKQTWAEIKCVAKNSMRWRKLVDTLSSATD